MGQAKPTDDGSTSICWTRGPSSRLSTRLPKTTLCLSSCSTFKSYENASPNPAPYQAIIGPNRDVGWCEALIAFSTFYYQACILRKEFSVATVAMNFASGAAYTGKPTYELRMPH
jgi:hypothetical protein